MEHPCRDGDRRTGSPRRLRCLGATLVVALAATLASGADLFYERLLRRGTDAYNRGAYGEAARLLRVACFGFLDEPELLADGLVRLAMAQAASGDAEGFSLSFQRISEIESRMGAYTRAAIPPDLRLAYEKALVQAIPVATLRLDPAFSRLVPGPADALAKLPPKQRIKELEALVKKEPDEPRWLIMLAEAELAGSSYPAAARHAEAALRLAPADRSARRLRGLALAGDERWQAALADLQGFVVEEDAEVAEATLASLVGLQRWAEAAELLTGLPGGTASRPKVAALGRRVAEATQARAAGKQTPTPTSVAAPGPGATPRLEPTPGPAAEASPAATSSLTAPPILTPVPTPAAEAAPRAKPGGVPAPTVAPTVEAPSTRTGRGTPTPAPRSTSGGELTAQDRAALTRAETLVQRGRLEEAYAAVAAVAEQRPAAREIQHQAAEYAYRIGRWADAVKLFRRGGAISEDKPLRQFYYAVALYETGDAQQAAVQLRAALPRIKRTAYVEEYVRNILGEGAVGR